MILNEDKPELFGLVLAGGKSKRMGTDKGIIIWREKEQRYILADMLMHFCDHVFISCRKDQSDSIIESGYRVLEDVQENAGPYGALLNAFKFKSNVAWLVLASDLPLMEIETLKYLVLERDSTKIATAYRSPYDNLPEPLISIWEPRSQNILLTRKEEGINCPRKVLLNSDIQLIEPVNVNALLNANTPEDADKVRKIINDGKVAKV